MEADTEAPARVPPTTVAAPVDRRAPPAIVEAPAGAPSAAELATRQLAQELLETDDEGDVPFTSWFGVHELSTTGHEKNTERTRGSTTLCHGPLA